MRVRSLLWVLISISLNVHAQQLDVQIGPTFTDDGGQGIGADESQFYRLVKGSSANGTGYYLEGWSLGTASRTFSTEVIAPIPKVRKFTYQTFAVHDAELVIYYSYFNNDLGALVLASTSFDHNGAMLGRPLELVSLKGKDMLELGSFRVLENPVLQETTIVSMKFSRVRKIYYGIGVMIEPDIEIYRFDRKMNMIRSSAVHVADCRAFKLQDIAPAKEGGLLLVIELVKDHMLGRNVDQQCADTYRVASISSEDVVSYTCLPVVITTAGMLTGIIRDTQNDLHYYMVAANAVLMVDVDPGSSDPLHRSVTPFEHDDDFRPIDIHCGAHGRFDLVWKQESFFDGRFHRVGFITSSMVPGVSFTEMKKFPLEQSFDVNGYLGGVYETQVLHLMDRTFLLTQQLRQDVGKMGGASGSWKKVNEKNKDLIPAYMVLNDDGSIGPLMPLITSALGKRINYSIEPACSLPGKFYVIRYSTGSRDVHFLRIQAPQE